MWSLPIYVEIDGKEYAIRNECDYRVVLDAIIALNDEELTENERWFCACYIFYEDFESIANTQLAIEKMLEIIGGGSNDEQESHKPQLMDWEQDFHLIAPAISKTLGYSVRDSASYTHWYDFLGAYMEIGDCVFANVISIRNKKIKGKKLEKHELDFYRENKKMIDLKTKLTKEEQEWLASDW
jgi:hypothetical protein